MLKAVIFDLDGLLVDSTPVQQEANRVFIESFGKPYAFPSSGREGMRIIDIIRDYKDIFDLPGSVEELYHQRQNIFFDLAKKHLKLFPGALPLLQKLKNKDLKLVLATSGDQNYVRLVFSTFPELQKYFTKAVTSEDVVRGKPYPDVFLKALEKIEVHAHEALVIEDSFNGVAAAKAAKIQVICIPNKHYPDADVSLADRIFTDLSEVESAIG